MIRRLLFAALALPLFAGACTDTAAPQVRLNTVMLGTPHADDGAILLRVTGPEMRNPVASQSSLRLYARQVAPTEMQVIVVGNLGGGPVLTFESSAAPEQFTASVIEVSTRGGALRPLAGYSIGVTR